MATEKGSFGKRRSRRQAWLDQKQKTGLAEIPEDDEKPFTKMLEEMKKKEAEQEETPSSTLRTGKQDCTLLLDLYSDYNPTACFRKLGSMVRINGL